MATLLEQVCIGTASGLGNQLCLHIEKRDMQGGIDQRKLDTCFNTCTLHGMKHFNRVISTGV